MDHWAPFLPQRYPDLRGRNDVVRLTAADGTEWNVWDGTWSKGKHHRRPHGDSTAMERVFVNAKGVRRAYKFKPSDSRVVEEQTLERQLRAAAFLLTTKEKQGRVFVERRGAADDVRSRASRAAPRFVEASRVGGT